MRRRPAAWLVLLAGCSMSCGSNPDPGIPLGESGSGGVSVTGGAPGTSGGSPSGGGTPTSGGASSGGASTGGSTSAGGVSTGGVSTGGVSTGGVSTGGAGTGGNSGKGGNVSTSGGAATGGSSAGGAATGTGGSSTAGAASGCGKAGAATGAQNLTIQVAGQSRSYVLFVPTAYAANTAMPLIFAWHGLGGSGSLARQYFGIERAASNQAIIVYPSGLPNSSGQAAWTLTQAGVDVQFFDALLADVASKYCVDKARVYSTGHSYGAMMTNALGCYRAPVLRGIAPVAGMPPFGNPTCTGAVAAWIAHGDNDAVVNYTTGGVATRDLWIKLNGCSATLAPAAVEPSPCVAYQGCSANRPLHWCVHQDNHDWPSFAGAGIWAFFSALK